MAKAFDAETHMRAMAATLDVEIAPGREAGVRQFLELAQHMNDLLEAAPVRPDSLELAPVFTPPERDA